MDSKNLDQIETKSRKYQYKEAPIKQNVEEDKHRIKTEQFESC